MVGTVVWVVSMPIDIDQDFREVIAKRNQANNKESFKRGDLKNCVQEAIRDWIRIQNQELMLSGHIKR